MNASDARIVLDALVAERREVAGTPRAQDSAFMAELAADISASRAAFVGLAVAEIASLRAQLGGPQSG